MGWLGAVQSQDYAGAKWGLAQRSREVTEPELDRLVDEGRILRTHVLRPTWHFVRVDDVRWLLELTGPRVRRGLGGRLRQLELDARTIGRSHAAFARALEGGRHLTRGELGDVLVAAGVSPAGQRLPHLILTAELEALIVSGSRRGRQLTYALFDERVPEAPAVDRDAALSELARRYFRSRGPAQVQDFLWWSGLTGADAVAGIAGAGDALERLVVDGREHWADATAGRVPASAAAVHLLPNFDELTVAYRDRTALHPDGPVDPSVFSFGSVLSNVVTVGGQVRGSWRRTASGRALRLEIRLLRSLPARERSGVEAAAARLGNFTGRPVELAWPR